MSNVQIRKLQRQVEKLKKESEEYLAGWKRVQADFENYKKEEARRMEELKKYIQGGLILEILPVLDSFNLALKHQPDSQQNMIEGVKNIRKQLEEILERHGVQRIIAKKGDEFNPELHEAVKTVKGKKDTIVKILQKGYVFNDKLLRPTKVEVGR